MSDRLSRKRPCLCTRTDLGDLSTFHFKWNGRCTLCNDTKEVDDYPETSKLHLKYKSVDWNKIHENYSECEINITCECGNELYVGDESVACKCGRIYSLTGNFRVNDEYLGKQNELWKAIDELKVKK